MKISHNASTGTATITCECALDNAYAMSMKQVNDTVVLFDDKAPTSTPMGMPTLDGMKGKVMGAYTKGKDAMYDTTTKTIKKAGWAAICGVGAGATALTVWGIKSLITGTPSV